MSKLDDIIMDKIVLPFMIKGFKDLAQSLGTADDKGAADMADAIANIGVAMREENKRQKEANKILKELGT